MVSDNTLYCAVNCLRVMYITKASLQLMKKLSFLEHTVKNAAKRKEREAARAAVINEEAANDEVDNESGSNEPVISDAVI